MTPANSPSVEAQLDRYYQQIQAVILERQHPVSGLMPASTAVNTHGNYQDAWVRDNVYSILAVWGLAIAYRKHGLQPTRAYQLEHSVIKLMRGLLFSMMQQADKVERFKNTQDPLDALHAKYDTPTGSTIVGDSEWGHLQLDATSLFLLMLAQMTSSGLRIIYSLDEVNFVQNLVWYIGRTYRTPDYGIWERGNKINHGNAELNASSIGMAKAALEAMSGFNLFGIEGDQSSVIHVMPDEIARTRLTLRSLLPRESASKEVDAATLSVIGFPAFAVEDAELIERTRHKIVEKLEGRYGCKRFLRDGHQTAIEDTSRLHYEPWELQQFEHIECEWPLFFTYLLLDGLFAGDRDRAQHYRDRLDFLQVRQGEFGLLPELYYVPLERIDAERANPRSQARLPNDNIPLVWAQSLYLLGQMLADDLIAPGDIDPLGRHLRSQRPQSQPLVQIALIAEDERLQAELAVRGIASQTPSQVAPIQIRSAADLAQVYGQVGRNAKLRLTGRPIRRLRSLSTAKVYRLAGERVVFLPTFLDQRQSYLPLDYTLLIDQFKSELRYIQRNWDALGRPTLTLLITHTMLETGQEALLDLMAELQQGECYGVAIKLGPLQQLLRTASTERIDDLHDFRFVEAAVQDGQQQQQYWLKHDPASDRPLSRRQEFDLEVEADIEVLIQQLRDSANLYEQVELLQDLQAIAGEAAEIQLHGDRPPVSLTTLLEEVYERGAQLRLWGVLRRAAGLLGRVDISLADAVTDLLVRQKQIAVGKAYSRDSLIVEPLTTPELQEKINLYCREDIRERVLTQEILVHLNVLVKSDPDQFRGFLTLRVGYLILLLTSDLAQERQLTQDEAYEQLMQLSPHEVKQRLRSVIFGFDTVNQLLRQQESLHLNTAVSNIVWQIPETNGQSEESTQKNWHLQRQREGALNRVPTRFYPCVWEVMCHCRGLVIGDKLERRNRLDSDPLLAEMTPGEKNFALYIEHLLNKIDAPEYRQITIEALMSLHSFFEDNPSLRLEDYIVLDVLVGHAVRLAWLADHADRRDRYDEDKAAAWQQFYQRSPEQCRRFVLEAVRFLSEEKQPVPAAELPR
ncbi:glycoside hydrolase family 15 protein [Synechococcus elongatus]|uniref:glycoside hydrolase family 15 protein n=1 Tax=Synechococcus elongatus TaxID=32046 RepID=UPI0030D157FC